MKNKTTILIVDDEESIRFAFSQHLSREGCEVLTASDFDSALDILAEIEPDLVISDIVLEGHSGIDVLQEIKKRELRCPVIIITGEPNIETASEAVRLGAFDYLPKPIRKETLLRITKTALRHQALLNEKEYFEAEKERYRQNLEAIFRSLSDAIISVDEQMQVIEANDSVENICQLAPREIIKTRFSADASQCSKACYQVLERALTIKTPQKECRIDCKMKNRLGQVVLVSTSPLFSGERKSMGAIMLIRDITRLNNLEIQLQKRRQFHNIIGQSSKMQNVFSLIKDLAETDTTVLITGESGTGKELVARALHFESPRAEKPLITINCSALSENLLESELFGHVKGAYTGAIKDKSGRFQLANQGTIFLDEIGEISPLIQLKLLRVLQEKQFEKVGDSKTITVNIRILAATNCDLKQKVSRGEFRKDLYYRLNIVEVLLPPLRERREDIPVLTNHFFQLLQDRLKKDIAGLSAEVFERLIAYPWPGNVRELEHAIEHAFVLCHDDTIQPAHLPAGIKEYLQKTFTTGEVANENEALTITEALISSGWNKAKAARLLGLSRQGIYRKITKYNIALPES